MTGDEDAAAPATAAAEFAILDGAGVKRRGRRPSHDGRWTKVTVVLFNRQIVFLDRLAANIRAQSGAAISRAQLIRALLDAVADADIDLTSSTSEADLKATILARLGRYRLLSER